MYMCDENYFGQAGSFTKDCFNVDLRLTHKLDIFIADRNGVAFKIVYMSLILDSWDCCEDCCEVSDFIHPKILKL